MEEQDKGDIQTIEEKSHMENSTKFSHKESYWVIGSNLSIPRHCVSQSFLYVEKSNNYKYVQKNHVKMQLQIFGF